MGGIDVMHAGSSSLRVVLVRHGQTGWNAESRYQGHRDIPLSATGLEQADALAAHMAGWDIAAVYSSDLSRAFETASRIASPHGLRVVKDRRLREMCFGDWEARTHQQIESDYPELCSAWLRAPMTTRPPNGETLAELRDRGLDALRDIVRAWVESAIPAAHGLDQRIIVACHGGPIRALLSTILGLPLGEGFWRLTARPGSYAVIRGDDGAWRRFASHGPEAHHALDVECVDMLPGSA